MTEWITSVVTTLGYPGIGMLALLENVFPPIPSEVIMPLAGFTAAKGGFSVWWTILAGSAGSLAGTCGWYMAARKVGRPRLERWIDAYGRWLTIEREDLDKATAWFDHHGRAAVLVGRFVPVVRTIISAPAGVCGLAPVPFLLYSAVGTTAWTAGLTFAGYILGERYDRVSAYVGVATWVVLAAMAIIYAARVRKRGLRRARR